MSTSEAKDLGAAHSVRMRSHSAASRPLHAAMAHSMQSNVMTPVSSAAMASSRIADMLPKGARLMHALQAALLSLGVECVGRVSVWERNDATVGHANSYLEDPGVLA